MIAAGPSLENELVSLKAVLESNERQNICVICVGKISRKLLENKIKPDYIAVTDAKDSTRWQISGIEDCGIPLLYLSTAASNVVSLSLIHI